jgi:hypothetical protein
MLLLCRILTKQKQKKLKENFLLFKINIRKVIELMKYHSNEYIIVVKQELKNREMLSKR